ncbi:gliding motility-associated C-terminal domain-containing protein [Zeaxanthinibacter enoshimensis]|uniref:T9SS type B sorting domain-containing protein n=1 Tax=Zeaxanthinibacter enoshimensis TaxID=392009 RepID=UPI00356A1218
MKSLLSSFATAILKAGVAFLLSYCSLGVLLAQQEDLQQVFPSDKNSAENFGYAVDVKADRAIIGSLRDTYDLDNQNYMTGSGAAYIYELNSEGEWIEKQKLIASDRTAGDRFSQSVAISGDYAAVSTMYRNNNKGAIYIFERNTAGFWEEKQILEAQDGVENDLFGHQIDLEGDWLVANAIWEDEDADGLNTMDRAGSAYVFHRANDGVWRQSQKIVASDRSAYREFSRGVDLHAETLVVGAPSAGPQYKGAVYVFERNAEGVYQEQQIIAPADYPTSSNFGWSVAVSEKHIMANIMPYSDPGAVYVFEKNTEGSWTEHSKLQAPAIVNDRFGYSIGLDGNLAVIGAYRDSYDEYNGSYLLEAGSAYVYEQDQEGNWTLKRKLVAPQRGTYWNYGEAVALSGNEILVGSARVSISAWPDPAYVDRIGSGYFYRLDRVAPSGYEIDLPADITDENVLSFSFSFAGGEIGSNYHVEFHHIASGATKTFSGTVENNPQAAGDFDLTDLPDGTLELELYLVDSSGNQGELKTSAIQKSTTPTGYLLSNLTNPILASNSTTVHFAVDKAEPGTTFNYVFTDTAGNEISGSGNVPGVYFEVDGIDLSTLADGPLVLSFTLTDGEGLTGAAEIANSLKDTQSPSGYSISSGMEFINSANVAGFVFNWNDAEIGSSWGYSIRHTSEAGELTGSGPVIQQNEASGPLDLSQLPDGEIIISFWLTDAHGQQGDTASLTVLKDTVAPVINCREVVLSLDANGNASIEAAMFDDGSTDESGISTMEINMESILDCSYTGTHEIELTVWDNYMNSSSCITSLTIQDDMAPLLEVRNIEATLDETGEVKIQAADLVLSSADNCADLTIELDRDTFSCTDLGSREVMITATDANGNRSSLPAMVEIVDTTAPEIMVSDLTLELGEEGTVSLAAEQLGAGSTDNCGIVSFTASQEIFSCEDLGTTQVILTVSDSAGNRSTATAQVTVIDTMAPDIVGRDLIVYLDANGEAFIAPEDIDAGTTDNCGIASLEVDKQLFSCEDVGEQQLMFMATDADGNFSEIAVSVTVINDYEDLDEDGIPDNCDPEITAPDSSAGQDDTVSDPMDQVKIPETFTPNGDGINDTWNIVNLEMYPTATVYVYNRYGQVVYSTRAYANDWDGSFKKSGRILPEGATYYYQIDLDSDGKIDKEGWLFVTE